MALDAEPFTGIGQNNVGWIAQPIAKFKIGGISRPRIGAERPVPTLRVAVQVNTQPIDLNRDDGFPCPKAGQGIQANRQPLGREAGGIPVNRWNCCGSECKAPGPETAVLPQIDRMTEGSSKDSSSLGLQAIDSN